MTAGNHLEMALAQGRTAPRDARNQVQALLDAHGLDGEAKQAALMIASELVTNAVVHAWEPITLELALRDHTLRLEVCDGDDRTAIVAACHPHGDATTGRGLELVASLARRWGVRNHGDGKSVWAEIDLPSREHAEDQD
jgi:anti-sigma regulatory factor (Ser/Thr protein kinase)